MTGKAAAANPVPVKVDEFLAFTSGLL